ncbi:DUF4381 domain-containing protein [Pseudophaeobacter leonis]|uniref:DUF4381 domain-containing protein n=1 Tax=Pseudophaeobacter leonis TaxID=1144477 RepID=UPI0009F58C00|nr:DUF4381 domain-containing protein [Pseudophaeobacter leonis]
MSDDLAGLSLVELYDQLLMPAPPGPVAMWPQTVGWVWLVLGLVALLALAVGKLVAWRRATRYRRAALAELRLAGDDPVAIAIILRRAALSGFPRDAVAGLHGSDWLAFLDCATHRVQFGGTAAGEVLKQAPYRPQAPHKDLPDMAAAWIRTHRVPGVHGVPGAGA